MKKLDSIQVLRGVAALLVIFCHGAGEILANHASAAPGVWQFINAKGLFGVDIFFVVSGFVMMHIIADKPTGAAAAKRFVGDRMLRIMPLYWTTTLLSVCVGLVLPALKHKNAYSAVYVVRSLFFIPSTNPSTGAPEPVLGLGWTLNYEMFFYVVIGLLLLLGVRRVFMAVLALFVTLVVLGQLLAPENIVLRSWTHSIILEFGYGALLAHALRKGWCVGGKARLALLAAGIAGWLVAAPSNADFVLRGIVWGLPAMAIFAALALGRAAPTYPRLLTLIGDASYSLYLTHLFVMRICSLVVWHLPLGPALQIAIFMLVFPAAAIGVSILSYRHFELPTMRIGREFLKSRQRVSVLPRNMHDA
ncbi:acyltransferase family protein [Paraburkholderia bannensis]|uniref:acyltransferase family protein n=1 Tax=Paraburkholderia bannensis TaxID=765414 RepID=UPI002AB682CD|nr:acyltransferase [Paraburkholderia bannensis]